MSFLPFPIRFALWVLGLAGFIIVAVKWSPWWWAAAVVDAALILGAAHETRQGEKP